MSSSLVSIIVPVYKVEQYLPRCIDSLITQSYSNIEIILVDDGSPDKCGDICDEYANKDRRIKVIHKKNGGLSDARNAALDIVKGQYLSFVDSDDFVHCDYILTLLEACEKYECDVAQCDFKKGKLSFFPEVKRKKGKRVFDHVQVFYGRKLKITASAKLYKSSIFSTLRFPTGKITEDEFITYKAVYAAKKIALIKNAYYYYYQSPNSIMRSSKKEIKLDFVDAFEERIDFFQSQKEIELVALSKKEYAIRAMLYYIKYHTISDDVKNQLMLIFKKNKKGLLAYKNISLFEKLVLGGFNMCPSLVSFFANRFLIS